MIKRIYHKTLIVLIGLLMVISGSVFLFPVKKVNNTPKPSQGVDLTIIMLGDQQKPGVENISADFLASPLGQGVNSLTILSSGATADNQLTYLQTLMQGGTATAHVIDINTDWTATFAKNGWIVNLDPYLEVGELDAYSSGMVGSCEYQGSYYAYPYFMNLGALYYRKDLLDLYMPGWDETAFDTWEHLNETANFILNNESVWLDNPNLVGYIGQFDAYEGGVVNFFEWCGSNGALDLVTSTNEVNINVTKVKEAMDFLSALVPPQYTGVQGTDYIIPRAALVYDEASSGNLWLANNTIFLRQWPYVYSLSVANKMDFGLAPLPHFAGVTGYKTSCAAGAILAVPTATTGIAREAALNLTKFLGDTLAQERELTADVQPGPGYQPLGNFPALKSVYTSPPAGFEWIKNWTDQVDLTLSRPVHPKYPQISYIVSDYFSDLLRGQKSVDVALSEMQSDIQELINVPPGPFTLTSTAEDPDPVGIFNLTWTLADGAVNYSVYQYNKFIIEFNGSLTPLANEITDLTLSLSGYTDGTYYFIIVAHNEYGDTLSNCIEITVGLPLPGSFILVSTAEDPDDNGKFNLIWTTSENADNYSVYRYDKFIAEINGSLTPLANEITDLTLPLSGYTTGIYYFIIVAHNEYGDTLSNCIEVVVQIQKPSVILGYDTFFLIIVISMVLIIIVKKRHKQIIKT